jgi:hypothetical protein
MLPYVLNIGSGWVYGRIGRADFALPCSFYTVIMHDVPGTFLAFTHASL